MLVKGVLCQLFFLLTAQEPVRVHSIPPMLCALSRWGGAGPAAASLAEGGVGLSGLLWASHG